MRCCGVRLRMEYGFQLSCSDGYRISCFLSGEEKPCSIFSHVYSGYPEKQLVPL